MKLRGYRQHRATGEVWAVESEDSVDVGCVGPADAAKLLVLIGGRTVYTQVHHDHNKAALCLALEGQP